VTTLWQRGKGIWEFWNWEIGKFSLIRSFPTFFEVHVTSKKVGKFRLKPISQFPNSKIPNSQINL
jgi:hypothetical protein